MTHKCTVCGSEFALKRYLTQHTKAAKYCLKQREEQYAFKCACGKKFETSELIQDHFNVCLIGKNNALEERIKMLKFKIKNKDEIIATLNEKVAFLEGKNSDKARIYETVEKAALKDTNTKTVNNQYNKLLTFPLPLSTQSMEPKCNLITPGIVSRGQVALANFFVDKIATNDKGEIGIICTDKARKMFKYMREDDGKIVSDIEAVNLIKSFKSNSSVPIKKSLERIYQEYNRGDDIVDKEDNLESYRQIAREARAFGGPFVAQLIKRTYRKTEDGTLVKVDPPNGEKPEVEDGEIYDD